MRPPETDTNPLSETLGVWREARDERGAAANRHAAATMSMQRSILIAVGPPNGWHKLRRELEVSTNRRLPYQDGAASFRRLLGSALKDLNRARLAQLIRQR